MMKEFDINKYVQLKKELRQRDIDDKFGTQHHYESQSKLYKPINESTMETTKNLKQTIVDNKQNLTDILVPFTNQLMRANDQREELQAAPFYTSDLPEVEYRESTPKKSIKIIDLDKDLNETDRENLDDLSLLLPSEVYEKKNRGNTTEY